MQFRGEGWSIELTPIGYEFPERRIGRLHDTDANWLLIRCRVSAGSEIREVVDPALLAEEAIELADWLRDAAVRPAEETLEDLEFIEPLLRLRRSGSAADEVRLTISLDAEFGPRQKLDLWIGRGDLQAMSGRWRDELSPFPPRGRRAR